VGDRSGHVETNEGAGIPIDDPLRESERDALRGMLQDTESALVDAQARVKELKTECTTLEHILNRTSSESLRLRAALRISTDLIEAMKESRRAYGIAIQCVALEALHESPISDADTIKVYQCFLAKISNLREPGEG